MKKKALITTVAAVALVAAVGIGSTLAYFTDSENETNVVTFGHVDISLYEPEVSLKEDGTSYEIKEDAKTTTEGVEYGHVTPGEVLPKVPTIEVNKASERAYLRARLMIFDEKESFLVADEGQKTKVEELIENIAFHDGWVMGQDEDGNWDGYFYYKDIVNPGEKQVIFNQVTIPATWGNEVADVTFKIDVTAEAVQADNFTPVTDANGNIISWGDVAVESFEAEPQAEPIG